MRVSKSIPASSKELSQKLHQSDVKGMPLLLFEARNDVSFSVAEATDRYEDRKIRLVVEMV